MKLNRIAVLLLFCFVMGYIYSSRFAGPKPQSEILRTGSLDLPELPKPKALSQGIDFYDFYIDGARVWLYAPSRPDSQKIPLVMIAPAGSDLLEGMSLSQGDVPEHLPYVQEGFAVLAYELSGENNHLQFSYVNAGLENARNALEFVHAKVDFVDSAKIFAAGHSSAGDVALLFAAHEPSLAGVAIYNTSANGCWSQNSPYLKMKREEYPGLEQFCRKTRAASHINHMNVPSFIFGSVGDQVVDDVSVARLANNIISVGVETKHFRGRGDHYNSMINYGIPEGIKWMKLKLNRVE